MSKIYEPEIVVKLQDGGYEYYENFCFRNEEKIICLFCNFHAELTSLPESIGNLVNLQYLYF